MLKCFDLTDKDIALIQEIKNATGAGSAREIVRRAVEEYHQKIFGKNSAVEKIIPSTTPVNFR